MASMPLTLGANIFVSLSFSHMMWEAMAPGVVVGWVALNAAINLVRLWIARTIRRRGLIDTAPDRVLTYAWIGALASGLCWAWALVACAQAGQAHNIETGLTFCGLNAGSVIQNLTNRVSTLAFVLPNSIILIIIFMTGEAAHSQIVGVNLLLLTILMVRAAGRAERNFVGAARLRHEAAHLAESLQRANVAATAAMRQLDHAANHDPLTDLANRAAYRRAFEDRLVRAARGEGELTAMLIDLDRFKAINDTNGHAAGDAVLVEVARRLRALLGPEDVAARLGGDEFALLVFRERMDGQDGALADRIVQALGRPFDLPSDRAGQAVTAGASLGIARFPRDGRTRPELQIAADLALYAAKSDGRGGWRRFDESLRAPVRAGPAPAAGAPSVEDRSAEDRSADGPWAGLADDLAQALEAEAVAVWFQPQVEAGTGRACGLEALLRWHHPRHGAVPPPRTVAAAAAAGLSAALTRHVVRQACRIAAQLEACGRGDVRVSVNLAPDVFDACAPAELIAAELAAHGLAGSCLAVEITEQAAYGTERCGPQVEAIRALGVEVVIDDFGMAYASLDALRGLGFDGLKIDRAFVGGIADPGRDRALTGAILAFARSLGVGVVAEGVETEAQALVLRDLGCPVLQGYRYAPALSPTRALLWIAHNALGIEDGRADGAERRAAG
ncbi:putative bifunctional diguanylate cyclase/phosphodiesterase [Methylobacterium gregans]|nr:EAL domain-containing protein [Methylobacterium gregans]MDQ0523866.1 diguanylate cyclase (GGDEF)-like protein [Methylobacterium gregans]